MTKYPLDALLSLRRHRVDEAITNHAQILTRLKQAVAHHQELVDALSQYKIWKNEEIERRYQTILGKTLSQDDLEKFKAALARLDYEELLYQEKIDEAQASIDKLKKEEIDAKNAIKEANQAVVKLEEHRKIFLAREKLLEERLSEVELEDFRVKKKNF